jgi:hypothetical protein
MKPLFQPEELKSATATTKLPLECKYCGTTFYLNKHDIQNALIPSNHRKGKYCSRKCHHQSKIITKYHSVICLNCHLPFMKMEREITKYPNHFCTKSCATTYHNQHKTTGTRRSNLEIYLEKQLNILYPKLEINYNQKNAINSELDIYIPSLKLAFELNGIFHYEPIYGAAKLFQIQNNDQRKFQACIELGIEMCIIDASSLSYFKKERADKYLQIITNIIDAKLSPQR